MTHEHHAHDEQHEHQHGGKHHGHATHKRRPIHHDWRLWTAVILMLAAMSAYVLSLDEALGPRGEKEPAAPAPAPAIAP